ncbi:MAG: hypothetical protein K2P67_11475 [Gallionellaceae bacterium]|nr:hypothetical protein [Gallionellaceae bacterium]
MELMKRMLDSMNFRAAASQCQDMHGGQSPPTENLSFVFSALRIFDRHF